MLIRLAAEECDGWWDLGCNVSKWGEGQIAEFVKSIAQGVVDFLGWINTLWLAIASPSVESEAITTISGSLSWYTFVLALIGVIMAAGRMAMSNDFKSGLPAVKMLVNLILVTAVYTVGYSALLTAGDAFAPWIVEKATGEEMSLTGLLSVSTLLAPGIGGGLILSILAFLASLANVVFMVAGGALVKIMFAVLPSIAAASATEAGNQAFTKAKGWMLAFALFKPVAAIIYALGILVLKNPPALEGVDDAGMSIYNACVGVAVLIMAGLSLPALVKFVVPIASAATSSGFSGGAVAGGTVAAGSAVVMLGAAAATGGATAAAAGSSAATGGGPSAAASSGSSTAAQASSPDKGGSSSPTSTSTGNSGDGSAVPGSSSAEGSTNGGASGSTQPGTSSSGKGLQMAAQTAANGSGNQDDALEEIAGSDT